MNTLFPPTFTTSRRSSRKDAAAEPSDARSPHYESTPTAAGLDLSVYLPGVDATGVEIVVRGPDLVVIGRKSHPLRVNFAAANLESVQRDYELRLRLGRDLDYSALEAELNDGVLSLRLPRRHLRAA